MSTLEDVNPTQLIDALIQHWACWDEHEDFYLNNLAPSLVATPAKGDDVERPILQSLCRLLNREEWLVLPALIAERRAGVFREIEIERVRRQAQETARKEAARVEALRRDTEEYDRLRQEALQRQAEAKRNELLCEIGRRLRTDFLGADTFFRDSCADLIPLDDYNQERIPS